MNTRKINKYLEIGRKDINWYQECEQVFREIFGAERLTLVCKLFAATSINSSMKSNITLFRRALYEIENDLPVGDYLPNMQNQLHRIRAGKDLSGRKINSFAKAMSGDPNAVVVDIWLLRAFEMQRKYVAKSGKNAGKVNYGGPTDGQYTQIENWVRRKAKRMGIEPRQVSSMIWAGCRISTNGDTETHYKLRLRNAFNNLFGVI